jgi:hypothetical protein
VTTRGRSPGSGRSGRRGVGVFGCVTWGWALTLALLVLVGVSLLFSWLVNDPGRNPPPSGYAETACAAFQHLEAATGNLGDAVAAAERDDAEAALSATNAAEREALEGSRISSDLPEWGPGEPLTEVIASLIVANLNGVHALRSGTSDIARDELDVADELVNNGRNAFEERRFGFDCT